MSIGPQPAWRTIAVSSDRFDNRTALTVGDCWSVYRYVDSQYVHVGVLARYAGTRSFEAIHNDGRRWEGHRVRSKVKAIEAAIAAGVL